MDDLLLKLLLAVIAGGLIGAEREFHTGTGLRTLMLICLSSALFTIFSTIYTGGEGDPRRIAAAVVTGVGFLGAGMILRHKGGVFGLTTAATVWFVSALGMGIGLGMYLLATVSTVLVLFVLWAIPNMQRLAQSSQTMSYDVVTSRRELLHERFMTLMASQQLKVLGTTISKSSKGVNYNWRASGKPAAHEAAMLALLNEESIEEFHVI